MKSVNEKIEHIKNDQIYEINSLVTQQPHFVPENAFARMISYNDLNPRRSERRAATLVKKKQEDVDKVLKKFMKS